MIDLIKRNGNQNTTSEVRRLLVFVNLIATNVEVLCAVWDLMHYAFNLAQKPIRGTNSDITTSAHIAQNTCYGLPFQDNALGGLCKTHN